MSLEETIEKIGYYKYETSNKTFYNLCDEYPITEHIINYLKKSNHVKIEFEQNQPKLINGKFVVLV
jgi:hypothetical protein